MTPLVRMLAIIATLLFAMKVLTLAFARAEGTILGRRATLEYFGWMGMRPSLFTTRRRVDAGGAKAMALHGLGAFATGAALFATARWIAPFVAPLPVTLLAMLALSLMLHFGLFDLLAAAYRLRGVPAAKLFRAPLLARSLTEFWSRRWNVGFSEMIALVVHRPLRRRAGDTFALAASFLVSGLLHELAISVPVGAGYGLPTLYFLLHGALVAIERRMPRPPGHLWTLFWLAAPLPLVFHRPFIRGVIWPLLSLPG
jgi:Membrane bound O-acyl transferase family